MGIVIILYGLLEENNKYKYKYKYRSCFIKSNIELKMSYIVK
jgi:hypothetical protein